jgi:hypothetical protein
MPAKYFSGFDWKMLEMAHFCAMLDESSWGEYPIAKNEKQYCFPENWL